MMNAKSRPIKSVAVLSVAQLTAGLYACLGVMIDVSEAFTEPEKFKVPLGFLLPLLTLKLTFSFGRSGATLNLIGQLFWFTVLYGATGWLTGAACAAAYNLVSKHWGIHILGVVDPAPVNSETEKR
jgi:hypothetical protein